MTHSLHREGPRQDHDYVWLMYHAKDKNDQQLKERYSAAANLAVKNNTVNWGDVKSGPLVKIPQEQILEGIKNQSRIRGAFESIEDVTQFLADLKEADLGLCCIIAGQLDEVLGACEQVGLEPHTINYSLGVFGNREMLASDQTRAYSCMCGHHMVPNGVIDRLRDRVKRGKTTPEKAALQMAKLCPCGIFNQKRAQIMLEDEQNNQG